MLTVRRTDIFIDWLTNLKDRRAAARIAARILRLEAGNLGDVKPVGDGVSEARIDYGPGYWVYSRSPADSRSSPLRRRQGHASPRHHQSKEARCGMERVKTWP